MNISYTFGIVDFLNYGHIQILKKAKENGNLNIFGLINQKEAEKWYGNLVSNFKERQEVLKGIKYIDEIIIQDEINPSNSLLKLHEKYKNSKITIYCDKKFANMISEEILDIIAGKVEIVDYYEKLSPENISKEYLKVQKNEIISTKANTLLALREKLKFSKIEDIYIVLNKEYSSNKDKILEEIINKYKGKKIVIRSSCSNEDNYITSNAGHYESVLNIDSKDKLEIDKAIQRVFTSYKKELQDIYNEQVLIQTQTKNVKLSGVIFTRDINYNRPFYLINYDDNGSTDSVTSGISGKSLYVAYDYDISQLDTCWRKLLISIKEIQELLQGVVLDIEFAITNDNEIIIFQVRPLAANHKYNNIFYDDNKFFQLKNKNINKYLELKNIEGENNILLSDMAFWNPSEIIGDNPKPLDYSLYRGIITSNSWNEGLLELGYKRVNKDLMYKLGNKPYISVDDSFYSLIPKRLDNRLTKKLVNFYKERLKENLKLHDKIEFEIVYSCFDLNTEKQLEKLLEFDFSLEEIKLIKDELYNLTEVALLNYEKILLNDKKSLLELNVIKEKIEEEYSGYNCIELSKAISKLVLSLNKYGTPQFSRQARYAFIAKSICKSLVDNGLASEKEIEDFMLSINTIASDFKRDFDLYISGNFLKDDFNKKYGHLRSGTYDIRTDRYEKLNFKISEKKLEILEEKKVKKDEFISHLEKLNFRISKEKLIETLKKCIENREYFKYEFTKSLSLILEMIILLGNKLNISRNDMSYLELCDIEKINFYSNEEIEDELKMLIQIRKERYKENSKLLLPETVTSRKDFSIIEISESKPNFIGNKMIIEEIVLLEETPEENITGKIVVISKADPGFDWIFTKNIGGLVTKYGGVASHMAIRCAEFGIPAAIGCGEKIYDYVEKCKKIKLDCKNQRIINEI